jgi:hypothetical protein
MVALIVYAGAHWLQSWERKRREIQPVIARLLPLRTTKNLPNLPRDFDTLVHVSFGVNLCHVSCRVAEDNLGGL